jgi:hypothetical protein
VSLSLSFTKAAVQLGFGCIASDVSCSGSRPPELTLVKISEFDYCIWARPLTACQRPGSRAGYFFQVSIAANCNSTQQAGWRATVKLIHAKCWIFKACKDMRKHAERDC